MKLVEPSRLAPALGAVFLLILAGGWLWPPIAGVFLVFILPIALSFTIVGAFLAMRRPENPVGWLMLAFGGVASLNGASNQYFTYGAITHPGSLPGTDFVISLAVHTWHPGFALFILAFFLFPDGTLPSPRWRIPAAATALLGTVGVVFGMLEFEFQRTWDPIAGRAMDPLFGGTLRTIGDVVFGFCVLALVAMFAVSAVGLVVRLRRTRGVEREQIKWVVSAIVLTVVALVSSLFVFGNGTLGALMLPSIPISMAVAVLRYRLFDIDRLIRRTLVYATVTAVLTGIYSVIVVGVGTVFETENSTSPALVAAATLVLATLFRPLRNRLQTIVDRHFNRRRFDATRTIETFAAQLRNEIDLDSLSATLVATVNETIEPAQASLWLRSPRDY